jgi:hypothetical protein
MKQNNFTTDTKKPNIASMWIKVHAIFHSGLSTLCCGKQSILINQKMQVYQSTKFQIHRLLNTVNKKLTLAVGGRKKVLFCPSLYFLTGLQHSENDGTLVIVNFKCQFDCVNGFPER